MRRCPLQESGTLAKYSQANVHDAAPTEDGASTSAKGSPLAARAPATSLDFFFRELHSVRDMLKEEPQASAHSAGPAPC